ncbi:hypothetical protein HDV00_003440 [Rhizophlyctis rosea]|nr:hypothetical protein HDV00_003440 [Rhizophlyctis rosea]
MSWPNPPRFNFGGWEHRDTKAKARIKVINSPPPLSKAFIHNDPSRIANNANADIAADEYHRYTADLNYLKQLNCTMYRFSIAWPRIFPSGRGTVNQAGVDYYNKFINAIIQNGATPLATLYHWDHPQALEDQYGGWLDRRMVDDFEAYAAKAFSLFGDRVKYWLTINEPSSYCPKSYGDNYLAPGVKKGIKATYTCGHNVILAHAAAARKLRSLYPGSKISLPLVGDWGEPASSSSAGRRGYVFDDVSAYGIVAKLGTVDQAASISSLVGGHGWFADPLTRGDYPAAMKNDKTIGPNLPVFNTTEKAAVKGTIDFFGVNYYGATWAYASSSSPLGFTSSYKNPYTGAYIGTQAGSSWLYVYPSGLRKMLKWIHTTYPSLDVWVTENGVSVPGEGTMTTAQAIKDTFRVNYFKDHLKEVENAVGDGVPVKAYLAWTLLDNFEWRDGYSIRFGIVRVDYSSSSLTRTLKDSGRYLAQYFGGVAPAGGSSSGGTKGDWDFCT